MVARTRLVTKASRGAALTDATKDLNVIKYCKVIPFNIAEDH